MPDCVLKTLFLKCRRPLDLGQLASNLRTFPPVLVKTAYLQTQKSLQCLSHQSSVDSPPPSNWPFFLLATSRKPSLASHWTCPGIGPRTLQPHILVEVIFLENMDSCLLLLFQLPLLSASSCESREDSTFRDSTSVQTSVSEMRLKHGLK